MVVSLKEEWQEEWQKLREAATVAACAVSSTPRRRPVLDAWHLQTSNSFRRIGTARGDGDILSATMHPRDRHPDLLAPRGVLEYVVAAQPSVILALLDHLDAVEAELEAIAAVELARIVAIVEEHR